MQRSQGTKSRGWMYKKMLYKQFNVLTLQQTFTPGKILSPVPKEACTILLMAGTVSQKRAGFAVIIKSSKVSMT